MFELNVLRSPIVDLVLLEKDFSDSADLTTLTCIFELASTAPLFFCDAAEKQEKRRCDGGGRRSDDELTAFFSQLPPSDYSSRSQTKPR